MRQSRGELRRPVAELESQYQNALVQNGTFDPTQQDPTTTGSPPRVPPTLQHVPVHDDPQRYYDVDDTSFAPSASETFIFGEALLSVPLVTVTAPTDLPTLSKIARRLWRRVHPGHAAGAATARLVARVCPERVPVRRTQQLDEPPERFPDCGWERSRARGGIGRGVDGPVARWSKRRAVREKERSMKRKFILVIRRRRDGMNPLQLGDARSTVSGRHVLPTRSERLVYASSETTCRTAGVALLAGSTTFVS